MEIWPPAPIVPTVEELNPETDQVRKKERIGYIALAFSTVAVLIRVVAFLRIHNHLLEGISWLLVSVGWVLGLKSRSSLAGRLSLLGPLLFLGLVVYYFCLIF